MYKTIDSCRACGNQQLELVLDLGVQALTGVFPKTPEEEVPVGPLALVKCHGPNACGLVQLADSFDAERMYGNDYGYRSGLNQSMVRHLSQKVDSILEAFDPPPGSLVLDVGSNDGTTLAAYPPDRFRLVGVDPTAGKFRNFYPKGVEVVEDFFDTRVLDAVGGQKASIITSFSMFYDLDDPVGFMRDVRRALARTGVWVFEQSYLPLMLERNSYDTVCHEHLEYYSLAQVSWTAEQAGLKIIDVEFNDINGGSFCVTAAPIEADRRPTQRVEKALEAEGDLRLQDLETYHSFAARVEDSVRSIREFLHNARDQGRTVGALGASTKGNVLLQRCSINSDIVFAVGEVNSDKYGSYTPGTRIPIIPEDHLLAMEPDYLLVLPWHFRETFLGKTLPAGSRLVFPLPNLEVVGAKR